MSETHLTKRRTDQRRTSDREKLIQQALLDLAVKDTTGGRSTTRPNEATSMSEDNYPEAEAEDMVDS
jgi:hypothetical protein